MLSNTDFGAALAWSREHNRIALGWGGIGHVRAQGLDSPDAIANAIRRTYPGLPNAHNGGRALYDFVYTLREGDLVVLRSKKNEAVVRIAGDYRLAHAGESMHSGNYHHQRPVTFENLDPNAFWSAHGGLARGDPFIPLLPLAT